MTSLALLPGQPSHLAVLTAKGATFQRQGSVEEWGDLLAKVFLLHRANPWIIGDVMVWGSEQHGEECSQYFDEKLISPDTASNYANVARTFPHSKRRPGLSYSIHAVVYRLPEKEREALLDRAEKDGLTERALRDLARASRKEEVTVQLRLDVHKPSLPEVERQLDKPWWKDALKGWRRV